MLAGMMVDIGQFFLLARVADYPALVSRFDRFAEFVSVWDDPVSRSVLDAFELPDDIVDALDGNGPYDSAWPPESLHDIVRTAVLASDVPHPFRTRESEDAFPTGCLDDSGIDRLQFVTLLDETRTGKEAMLQAVYDGV